MNPRTYSFWIKDGPAGSFEITKEDAEAYTRRPDDASKHNFLDYLMDKYASHEASTRWRLNTRKIFPRMGYIGA